MNWFKVAGDSNFVNKIKKLLKEHPFTNALVSYYNIPLSDIDSHLVIELVDLDGKFAEGNGKLIRIDKKLLDDDFFNKNFHFVIHEFFHWLKRRSEKRFYFNDPEEVQSFVLQMVWEFVMGKSKEEVINKIYPILETHFKNDKQKLNHVFKEMIEKAIYLADIYKKEKNFSMQI